MSKEIVLFIILLRVLGVLPPDISPVNFDDLKEASFAVETSSSDIVNQLFWLTMAAFVTVPIVHNPSKLMSYVKPLSMLFIFLAFCLLSAVWATHPDISIRRSLLLIIGAYSVLGAVAYCRSPEAVLRVIYLALGVVLVINLASLPLPFAFDWRGLFRGVAGDKNFLGVLAALGLFIGVAWRGKIEGGVARVLNLAYIAAWLLVLSLTGAKTALWLAIVAPGLALLLMLGVRVLRVSLPAALVLVAFVLAFAFAVLTAGLGMEQNNVIGLFVSDVTFTGRDIIWQFILDQRETHWLLGFGYGSFWGVGLDAPNLAARQSFIRVLTQAHNGYLDVSLSVGMVGLLILMGFIWQIVILLDKARRLNGFLYRFATAAVIFILLHNLTDSSLARGVATPWIFLLCVSFILVKAVEAPEAGIQPRGQRARQRVSQLAKNLSGTRWINRDSVPPRGDSMGTNMLLK